jgi:hypothetical protein
MQVPLQVVLQEEQTGLADQVEAVDLLQVEDSYLVDRVAL